MLSPKEQDRILARGRADTKRYGELAAQLLAEPGFIERLGTYLNNRTPDRDNTDQLVRLRAQLRDALEALVKFGREA